MSGIHSQMWVGDINYNKESQWVVLLVSFFKWMLSTSGLLVCSYFCSMKAPFFPVWERINLVLSTWMGNRFLDTSSLTHNKRAQHQILLFFFADKVCSGSKNSTTQSQQNSNNKLPTGFIMYIRILHDFSLCLCLWKAGVHAMMWSITSFWDPISHQVSFHISLCNIALNTNLNRILGRLKPHELFVPNFRCLKPAQLLIDHYTHYVRPCYE